MIYFALTVLFALSFSETECRRPSKNRILSGTDAPLSRFDYYVSLNDNDGKGFCGGSLIRLRDHIVESDLVLTAAHCVTAEDLSVVNASNITIYNGNRDKLVSKVREVVRHPQYNHSIFKHDIALLVLDKPIPRNKIGSVRVAETKKSDFDNCEIAGWGNTIEYNKTDGYPNALQYGNASIHQNETGNCDWVPYFDPDTKLCTEPVGNGKASVCDGDSGGPLTCKSNTNGQFYLVGVTSYGWCIKGPSVYTWTTAYLQWIKDEAAFWKATA